MNEFDLIDHFFKQHSLQRHDVVMGIGDDCALLNVPVGKSLAVSTDTLVAGIHFLPDVPAYSLGYKALAVNLSDLAAMGAAPAWTLLALTLPEIHPAWLQDFAKGFADLAHEFNVALVGGDLTRGPLSITVTVFGFVSPQHALTRQGAKPGDNIYVTGTLGDAAWALALLKNNQESEAKRANVLNKLYCPVPRIHEGLILAGLASSAIDISDGLIADLNHILEASQVGADIRADWLPLSAGLKQLSDQSLARRYALNGGDDYELCFTMPPEKEQLLFATTGKSLTVTRVGQIQQSCGLQIDDEHGRMSLEQQGYTHF